MRRIFCLLVVLLYVNNALSQHYKPVDSLSEVKFTIKNFGINTPGSFKGLKGKINFSANNLANNSFNLSVEAGSVNTGIDLRDSHLKKTDYFDVAKYPIITFISTKITADVAETGTYTIFGRLSLKGISKDISFPFKAVQQNNGLLFTGAFKINRRDFNVGGSTAVLSNSVEMNLKVFVVKN